jgi:hypothetical protein
MKQKIVRYHKDQEGDWVAELACGHNQHVRHMPPWQNRPWVINEAGRQQKIGEELDCTKCESGAARDWDEI